SAPCTADAAPSRIIDGRARGAREDSEPRIAIDTVPVVDPIVGDPDLGTPFAIPTNGSSPTVDRAVVTAGAFARARFVVGETLGAAGVPDPVALYPAAPGVVFEALEPVAIVDDGPGHRATARLVPVDTLGNVTDPPPGTTVTLLASAGLQIASPDTDGDPSHEDILLDKASGVVIAIDDDGGVNDSGPGGTIT